MASFSKDNRPRPKGNTLTELHLVLGIALVMRFAEKLSLSDLAHVVTSHFSLSVQEVFLQDLFFFLAFVVPLAVPNGLTPPLPVILRSVDQ